MKLAGETSSSEEITRATTAVVVVLLVVLALALIAGVAGLRATRNQHRAETAEADAKQRLGNAYLATARATRISGEPGRRATALGIISNAANLQVSAALRTEAIASLALSDLIQEGPLLTTPNNLVAQTIDNALEKYAYSDEQGKIHIGSLATREPLFELDASQIGKRVLTPARNLTFSPDGKTLAARFTGAALVVWDLQTQKILMSADLESSRYTLGTITYTPDSKCIIFADPENQGQIVVCDVATGKTISTGISVNSKFFRLRPDGQRVAIIDNSSVTLMDYPSGRNAETLLHSALVTILAWSPDGNHLATAAEDGDIYIWDLPENTHRILRGHTERCVNLGFSVDGTQFFSSSRDGMTRLWDLAQGQTIAIGDGNAESFSPDGTRLAFWRTFNGFGTWSLSRNADYRLLSCPKSEGPLFTLDLSPSGRWCVATQNKGFRLWDLAAQEREYYVPMAGIYCARISPDERSLFIGRNSGLEVWPLTHWIGSALQLNATNAGSIKLPLPFGVRAIALSLDGNSAAIELTNHQIATVDLTGKREPVFLNGRCRFVNFKGPGSPTGAGRFAMSPDGRYVVTGFDFGGSDVPRVWDAHTGALLATLDSGSSVVTFSPDGKNFALAGMARYSLWSVGDWQKLQEFNRDEPSLTHGTIALGVNNRMMAVTSNRKNVQIYSHFGGEKLFDLLSPTVLSINSIRLSLDGSVLVTATANDLVQVWHLGALQKELATYNLAWDQPTPDATNRPVATNSAFSINDPRAILALSLSGVFLACIFGVILLRQQRTSVARFIQAEAKATLRNRELATAKTELLQGQKMQALGTLAAGVAHDFNNLLSIIRMANKLIGRSSKDHEIQEHVADIEQASVQGKNVVQSMLGYARNESFPTQPTKINEVIQNTMTLLNNEFLSDIRLTLQLLPGLPFLAVNQGRLEQILLNLIVNASEAMQGRGELKIITRIGLANQCGQIVLAPQKAAQYVELQVSDSGPGISPEIIERIFEPFFSTKFSAATPGTGLGLSLVYSLSKQEGLGLSVESIAGTGATFYVLIPVTDH